MRLRRFPHLSREDVKLLEQLPPDAAREFERELRRQHNSDQRYRRASAAAIAAAELATRGRLFL